MQQGYGHWVAPRVFVLAMPSVQGYPTAASTLNQLQLRRQLHTWSKVIQNQAATLSVTSHHIQIGFPSLASAIIITVADLTRNQHRTALTQSKGSSNSHHSLMTNNVNKRDGTGRRQDCPFWKYCYLKITWDMIYYTLKQTHHPTHTNHNHNTHCNNETETTDRPPP